MNKNQNNNFLLFNKFKMKILIIFIFYLIILSKANNYYGKYFKFKNYNIILFL